MLLLSNPAPNGPSAPASADPNILTDSLYQDLYQRAKRAMARQPREHTLQATALVNEAYLRLRQGTRDGWTDREHFLASACQAMRHILVDHARTRERSKRQPQGQRRPLDEILAHFHRQGPNLVELDLALERLGRFDPIMERAVELHFFGGMPLVEVAPTLGLAKRTFDRRWQAAKRWLRLELQTRPA